MVSDLVQLVRSKAIESKKITWIYEGIVNLLYRCNPIIPQEITCKLTYYISMGYWPDLKHPTNFNEKIQWIKINYRDSLYIKCADKYEVREYVAEKGLESILIPCIGIFNSPKEIDFDLLPVKFVMKCTNGCGTNLVCQDKSRLDYDNIQKMFQKWMYKKIGYISGEYHYNYIKPRIIIEKSLCKEDGKLPLDYKIYCFNGKPHCVCVYSDRDPVTQETRRCYFDTDWNYLEYCTDRYQTDYHRFDKPKRLEYMIYVAEILSKDFPFVRVDLYEVDGQVYFGELTFTPTGGRGKAYNDYCNNNMGDIFILPEAALDKNWKHYV